MTSANGEIKGNVSVAEGLKFGYQNLTKNQKIVYFSKTDSLWGMLKKEKQMLREK